MSGPSLSRRWTTAIDGEIQRSKPAVSDELVFVDSLDPAIYALSREDGTTVWTAAREGSLSDAAPVYRDGRVYVGSGGGSLHVFDATTGEESWQFSGDSAIVSSPAVHERTVYVGRNDGTVLALSDGRAAWQVELPNPIYSALAYDPDREYVYVSTSGGTLYALDAGDEGRTVWQKRSNSDVSTSSPVFDRDRSLVYFAANEVMALDAATGKPDWITSFYGTNAGSAPAFDSDLVYASGANGNIYALPVTGETIRTTPDWEFETRTTISADLALSERSLVVVSIDGSVHVLDPATGNPLDTATLPAETHSSPTLSDDEIVVGTCNGTIVSYELRR